MEEVRYLPSGDRAITVVFGKRIEETLNNRVHAMARSLRDRPVAGVREWIPAFCSLLIFYDPKVIRYSGLVKELSERVTEEGGRTEEPKRILKIPVCYGARFGPDLSDMERMTGLGRDEIIALHSGTDYKIYMLGFLPGFVYLGGLPERLAVPRLATPRLRIEPGSVGIGGSQTGVYPLASPGGWRILGATPVDFYRPDQDEAILCHAGEYLRFVPISVDEFYDIRREASLGRYVPERREEERRCCI